MDFISIPFSVPGFSMHDHHSWRAWAPSQIASKEWYALFEQKIMSSLGKSYLPVVRLADGEFSFLFGTLDANPRWAFNRRLRHKLLETYRRRVLKKDFSFRTRSDVSSARYTQAEWNYSRASYSETLAWIAKKGYLAPQLAFLERPTMEQFQAKFINWTKEVALETSLLNITQFYYVYALLLAKDRPKVIDGKNVIVIHGATGERKEKIIAALGVRGARNVGWISISNDRSLFDKVDCSNYQSGYDIAFLGAGVGKPIIIKQLEPLSIPVIDIGYVFEVWIEEECRHFRPFCCSDDYFDIDKAKKHPTLEFILKDL